MSWGSDTAGAGSAKHKQAVIPAKEGDPGSAKQREERSIASGKRNHPPIFCIKASDKAAAARYEAAKAVCKTETATNARQLSKGALAAANNRAAARDCPGSSLRKKRSTTLASR